MIASGEDQILSQFRRNFVRNLEFTEYFSCGKGHSELRVLIEAEGENN